MSAQVEQLSDNIDEGLLDLTGDAYTELWRVVWPTETSEALASREEAEAWAQRYPEMGIGEVQHRTILQSYQATEWASVAPQAEEEKSPSVKGG